MKNIYIKILLIILLIPQIFVAQTQKISELENKRKILKEEILKINSLLIDNSKKKKNAFSDLENLTFKIIRKEEKWVRITTAGNIAGPCGTSKNKKNPDRCLPAAKARSLTKAQRAATARKKRKAGAKGKTVVKILKKQQ